jgi:hypothetical protein
MNVPPWPLVEWMTALLASSLTARIRSSARGQPVRASPANRRAMATAAGVPGKVAVRSDVLWAMVRRIRAGWLCPAHCDGNRRGLRTVGHGAALLILAGIDGATVRAVVVTLKSTARLDLALTLATTGRLDEAGQTALEAVTLRLLVPSSYWRAEEVITAVAARAEPQTRDLREAYREICTHAPQRRPRPLPN